MLPTYESRSSGQQLFPVSDGNQYGQLFETVPKKAVVTREQLITLNLSVGCDKKVGDYSRA